MLTLRPPTVGEAKGLTARLQTREGRRRDGRRWRGLEMAFAHGERCLVVVGWFVVMKEGEKKNTDLWVAAFRL